MTFTTIAAAPTATTGVGQPNGATTAMLSGFVNPNGSATDVWFEWGTSTSYGNSTSHVSIGNGTSVVQQFPQLSNLTPGTTYHFRVVAQNSGGTSYGDDASFTMPTAATVPPTIKTCRVINPTPTFTTLECTVNPNGSPMDAWFEWGTTTNYGNSTTLKSYGGTSSDDIQHTEIITGLSTGTRYYFKYIAKNTAGQSTINQTFIHGATTVYGFQTPAGVAGDPVNTATGSYTYQRKDIEIPGKGMPFVFERTYNSQDNQTGPLGFGWNHSLNIYLTTTQFSGSTYAIIHWGDGRTETYTPDGTGGFIPPQGVFDSLVINGDGTYTLRKKDQTSYNFNASNKLASIVDKNGNTITLAYTGTNLTEVTGTIGRIISFAYDGDNRIIQITDPIGRALQFTYDSNGDLESAKDLNGNITHYTYDGNHQMLTVVEPRGNTVVTTVYDDLSRVSYQFDAKNVKTTYAYDEANHKTIVSHDAAGLNIALTHFYDTFLRLIQETDALGNSAYYTYDTAGNRAEVKDKNGNITRYTYDSKGNVTSKTDALGSVTTITYDSNNNPLTRKDALGNTTTFEYDTDGNLIKIIDPLGNFTTRTYNAYGQPLTITDARANKTTNAYDDQGNLTEVTDALGNKTTYTYDDVGRRLSMRDALGRNTYYTYDNNNNLLTVTDSLGGITTYGYDENNNRSSVTDPMGNKTTYTYDVKDLLITTTDPLGNSINYTYDALDRKTSVTDKNGNKTNYSYDAVGNLISVTDPLGNVTTYTYDANGNKLTEKNPLTQETKYTYDNLNRVLSVTDSLGNTTTNTYDAFGKIIATTNAKGQKTEFQYDKLGRLTKITDANGGIVSYTCDENGNRLTMAEPNGNITSYTYDKLNRLIKKVEPLGSTYQYGYDAVGNRISMTDAKTNTTNYTYDDNNRLTLITYPDSSTASFTYDANGNRVKMVDSLGTSTYAYDKLNRMTSYTDPFGKTVSYGYDANGNKTSMTYPYGKAVTYVYDSLNRLKTVTDWLSKTTNYTYDSAGNLTSISNPNSTTSTYTYDSAERLTGLSNAKSDTTVISSYTYTLDEIGNHITVTKDEPLMPILSNKNITYTYDVENRLTNAGGVAFTHDANGNLTSKGTNTFTYDFNDRLIQSNIGGVVTTYSYDGLGNRLEKINAGATTKYVLDINGSLSNVLAETGAGGKIAAYYVYGLGLISKILPDGTAYYYHYDSRGSTVALSDASGKLTDKYAYDTFGNLVNSEGTTDNPFKYVGKYGVMEEGNGLKYMRARYYVPEFGRFITKDPQTGNDRDGQSLNRYVYALNNPLQLIDVSGFSAKEGVTNDNKGSSDYVPLHEYLISSVPIQLYEQQSNTAGTTPLTSDFDTTGLTKNLLKIAAKKGLEKGIKKILVTFINEHGFDLSGEFAFEAYKATGPLVDFISSWIDIYQNTYKYPERDNIEQMARFSIDVTYNTLNSLVCMVNAPACIVNSVQYSLNKEKYQDFYLNKIGIFGDLFYEWGWYPK